MVKLFWVSGDKQGSIPCGEYDSREAAEAAVAGALTELLGQCIVDKRADEGGMSEADVRRGTFEIVD